MGCLSCPQRSSGAVLKSLSVLPSKYPMESVAINILGLLPEPPDLCHGHGSFHGLAGGHVQLLFGSELSTLLEIALRVISKTLCTPSHSSAPEEVASPHRVWIPMK